MKTMLMIVYNDIDQDARVQRAVSALSDSYDITVLSYGYGPCDLNGIKVIKFNLDKKTNVQKYFQYIFYVLKYLNKKEFDIFYAHDFYGALPLLFNKIKKSAKKYVYDAHELYIPVEGERFSKRDRFFYFFEKRAIKKANLVICAQEKRSEIMKEHFDLKIAPTVIKNISYFPNASSSIPDAILKKCKEFFEIDAITIVYAGAISQERRIDALVDAVNELGLKYKLLIVGSGNHYELIKHKINLTCNHNILMIPSVPYINLAFLLKKCDIGYIFYPNKGLNNIYCAPNKIYEYASLGLPMISFYNPTIEEMYSGYRIGLTGNSLRKLIVQMSENILYYKANLVRFIKDNQWTDEAASLKQSIDGLFGR